MLEINKAKVGWDEIYRALTLTLVPTIKAMIRQVAELELKTDCPIANAAVLQKSLFLMTILRHTAKSTKSILRNTENLFNQAHRLDTLIRDTEMGVPLETTHIQLRGPAGSNMASPILIADLAEVKTQQEDGIKLCDKLIEQINLVLQPARSMTLQDLDDFREWVVKQRPALLEDKPDVDMAWLVPGSSDDN